jgi:hypothetical protein
LVAGCLFSIGLVLLIGYRLLKTLPIGGFQYLNSPNSEYTAYAKDFWNGDFWGRPEQYYEFEITNNTTGKSVRKLRMKPLDETPMFDMREGGNIIIWSSDSSEVVFAFQDIELKLKVEEGKK